MAADLKIFFRVAAIYSEPSCGLVMLALLIVPGIAIAQALTDPTRPPVEISAPPALVGQAAVVDSGLQSVIISPTRRAAIINGRTVELGANHGDARLVEVSESGVVLEGAQGRQALMLFPGVDLKRKVEPPPEKINHKKHRAKKPRSAHKVAEHAAPKEDR